MNAMKKMDMLGLLQEHGAFVDGHFLLPSGLHSPVYLQTALVLQHPNVAHKIGRAIAEKFAQSADVVVSPGMDSVVLGQEVARIKKCRSIFAERTHGGTMGFRRDFRLERGERALIIEDVLTTGRLTGEVVALINAYGAKIVGVGAIVDRSIAQLSLKVPMRSLVSFPLEVVPPDQCPQCQAGLPITNISQRPAAGSGIMEAE